jgi:hypothetical protein
MSKSRLPVLALTDYAERCGALMRFDLLIPEDAANGEWLILDIFNE